MRWVGPKPRTGLPAAARRERYRLLAKAARAEGATHILTAHTSDDQAETLLMRLLRGSGLAGLAAMTRESDRDDVRLARPFLQVAKSRLIATLKKAEIDFAEDPTNSDLNFTRPRLRALMPVLAAEGGDVKNLTRLASRLARANAALEILADGAERYLALIGRGTPSARQDAGSLDFTSFDAVAFAGLPEEIRLRLLLRAVDTHGHEGPAELGKVEALLAALDLAVAETLPVGSNLKGKRPKAPGLKQTLAGALVSLSGGVVRIEPAPPRRGGPRETE
jgi:tRNA(Ile)-lysidine synthase